MRDLILYSKDRAWLVGIIVFLGSMILLSILLGGAVCSDGWASASIGRRGACSSHGGVDRTAGAIKFLLSIGATVWAVVAYSAGREKWLAKLRANSEIPTTGTGTGTGTEIPTISLKVVSPPTNSPVLHPKAARLKSSPKVKCPICGGGMSVRTSRVGKNAGGKFWGCKRFPRCKGTKTHYPDFCQ